MRITNKIMTNNTLNNINRNKQNLTSIEEQYNTGKKIQRPSDDPIIAVRALKLRNNLTEINQYYEKNVPDARSWMEVTESALKQATGLMTSIHTLCNQGSQDTLTKEDRDSIMRTLQQYTDQIYQEGNATFAGRYVFTGFKTNTSLSYLEPDDSKTYEITEHLNFAEDIVSKQKILGTYSETDYQAGTTMEFEEPPKLEDVYCIRLAYAGLDEATNDIHDRIPTITYIDEDGEEQTLDLNFTSTNRAGDEEGLTSFSMDAYKPEDGRVNFLADTGELILSKEAYEALQRSSAINVTYCKSSFTKGDLRPEHYFDCVAYKHDENGELTEEDAVTFIKQNQEIEYDVSFNQRLAINTQGSEAFKHDLGREISEIEDSIEQVNLIESNIEAVTKYLANAEDEEDIKALTALKTQLELQMSLAESKMQKCFENSLDFITNIQEGVNIAIADLGSRMVRLDLTETRLSTQTTEFEDLMSNNEDADIVDTIVRFNSQETIYNASLSAAAKVVQNTLMDFIR